MLGIALYLVKVLHDPLAFTFGDELSRVRTADDIFLTGHLFDANPINFITPFYPGFQAITAALAHLSGASLFHSGLAVIGTARLITVLAVFLIIERAGGSARLGGIAVAIYAANPNFLLQGSQFSYESVGLPIALVALLAAAGPAKKATGRPLVLATIVLGAGAVITHHAASYALALMLAAWAAATAAFRGRGRPVEMGGSAAAAAIIIALCALWLVGVAHETLKYLSDDPTQGLHQLADLVNGKGGGRKPFGARGGGSHIPVAERIVGVASVLILLAGIVAGSLAQWRLRPFTPIRLVFLITALLYPLTIALRLAPSGQETAARSSEYLFMGMAFVIGVYALRADSRRTGPRRSVDMLRLLALGILFAGGVVIGGSTTARAPGPYLVGGGTRSYEPEGVSAARWTRATRGPGHSIAADAENSTLMGSLGRQTPHGIGGIGSSVWPLYFTNSFGREQYALLRRNKTQYLVADARLGMSLPVDGRYINKGEPDERLTLAEIAKFAHIRGFYRIYDSTNIDIFDVSALSGIRARGPR